MNGTTVPAVIGEDSEGDEKAKPPRDRTAPHKFVAHHEDCCFYDLGSCAYTCGCQHDFPPAMAEHDDRVEASTPVVGQGWSPTASLAVPVGIEARRGHDYLRGLRPHPGI